MCCSYTAGTPFAHSIQSTTTVTTITEFHSIIFVLFFPFIVHHRRFVKHVVTHLVHVLRLQTPYLFDGKLSLAHRPTDHQFRSTARVRTGFRLLPLQFPELSACARTHSRTGTICRAVDDGDRRIVPDFARFSVLDGDGLTGLQRRAVVVLNLGCTVDLIPVEKTAEMKIQMRS
mgnify:CR=1 FL=1